eukprot:CAMPEP_0114165684 /NCGR_PEP_ID=MMETSP0043_2-20121206/31398_1 /TAXON_ID=464988 /ORGANISM="Hemiselmis andersenii, Strain CCMP644" /LENGTH=54 /DNA_ID=CAMNT_0001262559 /DNA_START=324 /DNA_END=485 /DNA_ORIENTATION=-
MSPVIASAARICNSSWLSLCTPSMIALISGATFAGSLPVCTNTEATATSTDVCR